MLLALPGSHETVSPSQELRVFMSEDVSVDTTYMDVDQAAADTKITKVRERSADHGHKYRGIIRIIERVASSCFDVIRLKRQETTP